MEHPIAIAAQIAIGNPQCGQGAGTHAFFTLGCKPIAMSLNRWPCRLWASGRALGPAGPPHRFRRHPHWIARRIVH